VTLDSVPWSPVPRWVSRPVNLSGATSTGVELEVKGRIDELWAAAPLPPALTVRASLGAYRSAVRDIPGPDNRLEQQQPWSLGAGFDHRVPAHPLGFGANFAFTPGYATQLTSGQRRTVGRARTLEGYLSWTFSREAVMRLSAGPLPRNTARTLQETVEAGGERLFDDNRIRQRANWSLGLQLKF
jgi:outer membrane receptor for ferrienterochelin and colicins